MENSNTSWSGIALGVVYYLVYAGIVYSGVTVCMGMRNWWSMTYVIRQTETKSFMLRARKHHNFVFLERGEVIKVKQT